MAVKRTGGSVPKGENTLKLPDLGDMEAGEQRKITINLGVEDETTPAKSVDEFRDSAWWVYRQDATGWVYTDSVEGRPYEPDLRVNYGLGRYKLVPLDEDGNPVESFKVIAQVGSAEPSKPTRESVVVESERHPDDNLPAWTQLMIQQAQQEREEARRAQASADKRRQEWEAKQQEREWERQERMERLERERLEREDKERERKERERKELLTQGAGVLGTIVTGILGAMQSREPKGPDMSEKLLTMLIAQQNQSQRQPQQGGMKETLELLMVLDKMAENRAAMTNPAPADDDPMKGMMAMLPMIMAMKGGGGGLNPEQIKSMMGDQVRAAFRDPDTITRIASENPDETAAAFMQAVKANPALEQAVVKALEEDAA